MEEPARAGPEIVYTVDEEGRITSVNEAWDRFANENDSPGASAAAVVGTVLWNHVSDPTLRELLRQLFERVRARRTRLLLTCRCDAPHAKRELRLSLESPDGRTIRVGNRITSEVPRAIAPASEKPGAYLRICSWCNRVAVDGRWVELEIAVETLELLHGPYHPPVTHGLCETCAERLESAG